MSSPIHTALQQKKRQQKRNIVSVLPPISPIYLPDFQGLSFVYKGHDVQTKLLAKHSAEAIVLAWEVCSLLKMDDEVILRGIQNISYTKHRLELLYNAQQRVFVLDDSFNGNTE